MPRPQGKDFKPPKRAKLDTFVPIAPQPGKQNGKQNTTGGPSEVVQDLNSVTKTHSGLYTTVNSRKGKEKAAQRTFDRRPDSLSGGDTFASGTALQNVGINAFQNGMAVAAVRQNRGLPENDVSGNLMHRLGYSGDIEPAVLGRHRAWQDGIEFSVLISQYGFSHSADTIYNQRGNISVIKREFANLSKLVCRRIPLVHELRMPDSTAACPDKIYYPEFFTRVEIHSPKVGIKSPIVLWLVVIDEPCCVGEPDIWLGKRFWEAFGSNLDLSQAPRNEIWTTAENENLLHGEAYNFAIGLSQGVASNRSFNCRSDGDETLNMIDWPIDIVDLAQPVSETTNESRYSATSSGDLEPSVYSMSTLPTFETYHPQIRYMSSKNNDLNDIEPHDLGGGAPLLDWGSVNTPRAGNCPDDPFSVPPTSHRTYTERENDPTYSFQDPDDNCQITGIAWTEADDPPGPGEQCHSNTRDRNADGWLISCRCRSWSLVDPSTSATGVDYEGLSSTLTVPTSMTSDNGGNE